MNLANLHPNDKAISMIALNTNQKGQIISICLKKGLYSINVNIQLFFLTPYLLSLLLKDCLFLFV